MVKTGVIKRRRVDRGVLTFLFLFLGITVFNPAHLSAAEVVDRIVAIVNEDIITLLELDRSFQPYVHKIKERGYTLEKEQQMMSKAREEVLNQLVDQKLNDQEIRRYGVEVSAKEIDNIIERIMEANYYTHEELREALLSRGMKMAEYRRHLKEQILRSKLIDLEVKSKIVITQADIEAYYEAHKEQYTGKTRYHLGSILMQVPAGADTEAKQDIKAKMTRIWERIRRGESFDTLARAHSESPLADEGGDLGLFSLDQVSPQIRRALKNIEAGQCTQVLDTEQGFQIFLVQEIVKDPDRSLEAVSAEIQQTLFNEIVNEKYETWINELRSRSHIQIIQ